MSEKLSVCLKCNAPLNQPPTGRPRVYCGPVCRQAAAYEIKRLQRRLEALETWASRLRHEPDRGYRDGVGRRHREQLASAEAEITDAEARLRALLAEPRGKSPEREEMEE
ncbi:MAG: hypothetical protein ABSB57_04755 [Dehalococcoidia bacterium]|jgi:hypothetical protein